MIMTGTPLRAASANKILDAESTKLSNYFNRTINDATTDRNVTKDSNEAVNMPTKVSKFYNTANEDGQERKIRNLTVTGIVEKFIASSLNATKERVKRNTLDPIKLVVNAENDITTDNSSLFFGKLFEMAEKMYKDLKLNDTVKVKDKAVHFETIFEDTSGNITGPSVEIGIYEKEYTNSTGKKFGEGSGYFKPIDEKFTLSPEAIDDSNRSRSKRVL